MPCVVDDRCQRHDPAGEVWVGVRTAGTEVPARAAEIRRALAAAGAELIPASDHGLEPVLAVHDPGLVGYLSTIWSEWERAGLTDDPGQDRVVPYLFATPGLLAGLEPHEPAATWARPGRWCFDTMTLVGPGTWEAALGAVACSRPPRSSTGSSPLPGPGRA
jgi:acetoin utilization deacetylase AcuC-like enzyme